MPKSKRTPKVDEEEMVDPAEMMFDEPAEHKHKKSHKHADPVVYAKKKHSTTKKGKSKSRPEEPEVSLKHIKKARSTTNKKAPKKTVVDEPKAAASAAATTTPRVKTAYLNFSSSVRDAFSNAMLPGWHDPTNKNPANVVFSAPLLFRISGMCWTVFGNKSIDFASVGAVIAFNLTKYISSPEGRARIAFLRGKPANDTSFPETHATLVEYIGKILAVYTTMTAPPFCQIELADTITPELIVCLYETKKTEIEACVAAKAASTDRALREAAELKASDTIKSARLDAADIFASTMAAAATTPIASNITVTPVAIDMTDATVTEPIPPVVEALTPAAPAANTN